MLQIEQLHFGWPGASDEVLVIDTLEVPAGCSLFLQGPSGCGKSTLLGLIAGVLLPRSGRVRVLGTDWAGLGAARRDAYRADHVGYLFQQFNLLPYLSLRDNVLLPCHFSRRRRERAAKRHGSAGGAADALLERVGLLPALWTQPAARLSVGQQQRAAAARALIGEPELVIADEPTSALDSALRDSFIELLLQQCAEVRSALVFVSHDERLATHFDRQCVLPELNRAGRAARLGEAA